MKKRLNLIKHAAAFAVAAGVLCAADAANAQDRAPKADDQSSTANPAETAKEPTKVGSMTAIGQKPRKGDAQKTNATADTGTIAPGATSQMSDSDRQFMLMAAKDGMKEVHMGQMAAQQGQSPEIKKLGQQIAADHTKANQQLMAIAAKKGVKPTTDHKMDKMSKREMQNFDQAWIGMMINDHQKDIAAYQRQAQQGADPELKGFAKKTLPVLQKHLKMVQAAQKKMGSGGTNPAGMTGADAGGTGSTGATTAKSGR